MRGSTAISVRPPYIHVVSNPEDLSINSSSRAYRKALWAALAVFAILLLVMLATVYSDDENTTHPANESVPQVQESDNELTPHSQSSTSEVVCDKIASGNIQGLVDSLRPGQVGCLRGGVYTDPDKQVRFNNSGKRGNRIILRSYPGERATFRGSIYIPEGTNYVTVRGMRLDGSYGPVGRGHFENDRSTGQAIRVLGDNVNVRNNHITNRRANGNPDLAGTCILLGADRAGIVADRTFIEGNRIHHCGQMPRINREHGIYLSNSRNAIIQDNLIYNNADRGVQFYPNADNTLVSGNIIYGNGTGIVFAGSGDSVSSGNTVRNNVISDSQERWNISSNWDQTDKVGWDNKVYENCVWASNGRPNDGISPEEHGFDAYDNLIAEPAYINWEAGNFELGDDNPCRAVLEKQSGLLGELIFQLLSILNRSRVAGPPGGESVGPERGGRETVLMAGIEMPHERRLRASAGELGSVRLRRDDAPHGEAVAHR